jgi:hypothetical protein
MVGSEFGGDNRRSGLGRRAETRKGRERVDRGRRVAVVFR